MNSITYSSLTSMLPDGITRIKKYSMEESNKINSRINRQNEHKILAANQFLLICIKGKCRQSMDLLHPQTMKALNYNSKHIPTMHTKEARQPLDEEILIHSFISVQGKGNKKKYVDHFQLLKVMNKSKYKYIKKPQLTLSLFSPLNKRTIDLLKYQQISYHGPIDLLKQKSSIPPKKSYVYMFLFKDMNFN